MLENRSHRPVRSGRQQQRRSRHRRAVLLANECVEALNRLRRGDMRPPGSAATVMPGPARSAAMEQSLQYILNSCKLLIRRGLSPDADTSLLFKYKSNVSGGWCRLKAERAVLPKPGTGGSVCVLGNFPEHLRRRYEP